MRYGSVVYSKRTLKLGGKLGWSLGATVGATVGSMENGSPVEDSIKESISASASKDLAHARHVIGSEKAIIQKNRDIVE